MSGSYQGSNPRAAWRKREELVRRPHCRRDEAAAQVRAPDGYEHREAVRLVKRIKTAPSANLSTQAVVSSTSTLPPPPPPPLSIAIALPAGRPTLAAIASPPPPAPSTPTPSETLDPEQQPPADRPTASPAEASADATSDLTPSSSWPSALVSATTAFSTTKSSTSSTASVESRPRASMSKAPARENIIQEGSAAALTTPAAASPSTTAASTSRLIRNKALDDGTNGDSGQALAANAAVDTAPTAAVLLDSDSTAAAGSAVVLDTTAVPSAVTPVSFAVASDVFSPMTVLPGETPSPSSSASTSKTRTKKKCTSTTLGAGKSPAATSTAAITGNAASNGTATSSEDHRKAKGIIAGSIVGAAAALALLFLLLFFCYKRRKSRRSPSPSPSPTAAVPKRRSPYGRFSLHHISSSLPSIPRFAPLPFFGKKSTRSTASSTSEKSARQFPFLRTRSRSESSSISNNAPRAASYSAVRSALASSNNSRRSSYSQPSGFHLPEQSSTEGTLDMSPAFRTLSPVMESPRPTPQTAIASTKPFVSPLRNPFESPRKPSAAPSTQSCSTSSRSHPSLSQPLPPSPTASSVSNLLNSPTSFHTRSSGVLLPHERNERGRESSSSSSRTISLPPAYPQHSRLASEPEPAAIEPVGPWRDSMWSVAPTPVGNTPRGSSGWGGMGWSGQRGSGGPQQSTYGPNAGYGPSGSFANHRASKSSSHYTDASEWRETGSWAQTPAPLFAAGGSQGTQQGSEHMQVPSVPKIPDGISNGVGSDAGANASGAVGAAARTAHQRHPAVRAIPSAYIGARGHSRRRSSVGAPVWSQDGMPEERRGSDVSENGGSGGESQVGSNVGSNAGSSVAGGKSGRASENSVATVFRVHPGDLVKF